MAGESLLGEEVSGELLTPVSGELSSQIVFSSAAPVPPVPLGDGEGLSSPSAAPLEGVFVRVVASGVTLDLVVGDERPDFAPVTLSRFFRVMVNLIHDHVFNFSIFFLVPVIVFSPKMYNIFYTYFFAHSKF